MARSPSAPPTFATRVARWQRRHGRRGLPWQDTRDAYRIWLSEIMLQQTQVATALPYFERFVARFPTLGALAAADEGEVLALWSGLGYYARARNLHRAAREVAERHGGEVPTTSAELARLPGIGRSTAAAIAAFAAGERAAILDGNVRRVLARHAGVAGDPSAAGVVAKLWALAEARLPRRGIEAYTQGLMDLGATLCVTREPQCARCPVATDCVARLGDRVDELPGRRQRRARRSRRIAMLVVILRGEVLLEKRPARGIWGGLWSLPEGDVAVRPEETLAREWGLESAGVEPMAPFEHAFTHFTLEVQPWRVRLKKTARLAPEKPATWLPLSELAGAALPSPVKRLLQSLQGDASR
jgi:A/G-specific adenine glycosylase